MTINGLKCELNELIYLASTEIGRNSINDAIARIVEAFEKAPTLQPIETAPKDRTWILLAGPSGYLTTPLRVSVGRWDPEYRPHNPWQTHSNNAFTDDGDLPTHWMPLPTFPQTNK